MVIVGTSRLTHPTVSISTCGPAWCRSDWELQLLARPDVLPERTGLQRRTASGEAERSWEGPASFGCAQALRGGVHGGAPSGEPPPRIRNQGSGPGDDSQQFIGRRPFQAP